MKKAEECPKEEQGKQVREMDYSSYMILKLKGKGFPNKGVDLNNIPEGKHRVVDYYLSY
jgi:hypothetical protein